MHISVVYKKISLIFAANNNVTFILSINATGMQLINGCGYSHSTVKIINLVILTVHWALQMILMLHFSSKLVNLLLEIYEGNLCKSTDW